MNEGMIRFILGRMLLVEAGLMMLPFIVGLIYRESIKFIGSFLIVIGVLTALGLITGFKKPQNIHFSTKEGFVIVSLSWFLLSFFGGLPFLLSGEIPSLVDAFFETSSGFTTTGSSILTNVESMCHSMKYWRSFTHLIGGMGIFVFALAVLPDTTSDFVHIMNAEVPGPVFCKVVPKLRESARALYTTYLLMTAALILLLMFGGMDWFDASLHAFGAAGTGGFGIKNTSVAFYDSTYIDYVLAIAMIVFGVNFNLHSLLINGQVKKALKSEELRWYLAIIFLAVALICISISRQYASFPRLVRDAFFTVSSIITTTGYSTADFSAWPVFSHAILLLLMFFGACAGSTAGGLKISRVGILCKIVFAEVRRSKEPSRVVCIKFEGNLLDQSAVRSVVHYFIVYMAVFACLVVLLCLDAPDFLTAFSAVAATFNNIGPGLGMVGPTASFAELSDFSKIILSIGMIAGRLELYPVLVLFMPSTWCKLS